MKQRYAWLAAALALLLVGCRTAEPLETAPVPPDTSTPMEEPSPTLSPLEQLLFEQPIDDNHDAFLVDTKGELGTLLVTVELGEWDTESELGGYDATFFVWDPQDMDQPIQKMEKKTFNVFHCHEELDANFDGYMDFSYMYAMGNQPCYSYLWLWNEDAGRFEQEPEYSEISSPYCDPETEVIEGWARNSAAGDGVTTFHRWEDGKLVCVRRIEAYCPWGEAAIVSVEDRIDGVLRQVYYEEFPWDGEEIDGRELWRQVRHQWEDLDYHGEGPDFRELLAQQPRDENHRAFLMPTGGKLGTLLVTVEWGEQDTETEFGEYHYTLSVWNPADMDMPIQTFEEKACTFGSPYMMDANFDGYMDCCLVWNWFNINANYSLYIWDEAQGRFAFGGAFVSHGGPFPSEKTQTIRSYIHYTNASGVYEVYHWEDGELVCVREVEYCEPDLDNESQELVMRDLIGGEMKEIYRETFDFTSIFEEEEKWFDLDYHGE